MTEVIHMAFDNVMHAKKRSWLTMIGIFIGIAAVVALISLGQGLQEAIDDTFQKIGSDKVFIQPGGIFTQSAGGGNVPNPLTSRDVNVIKSVPGVEEVSGFLVRTGTIEVGDDLGYYFVAGVDNNDQRQYELFKEMMTIDLVDGRWLRPGEAGAATVGYDYTRKAVFQEPIGVGDRIKINGEKITVVGIHEPLGSPPDDRTVVISKDTAKRLLGVGDEEDWIVARVSPNRDPALVGAEIERELLDYRDLDEDERDFDVSTPEELMASFETILLIVQVVLVGIASISLLVGGVGIMNTMFTAVVERTKEIGIMKAIGATPRTIQLIFLSESGILGLVGGAIGVILGLSLSLATEYIAGAALRTEFIHAYISVWLVLGALAFSTVVGMVSGYLPARAASRQNAVDSLRYE